MPMQQQHAGSSSVGMLRRSRTLHHRPPPQEYRRRASHPASPSYCAATLHHCGGVAPCNVLPVGLPEEGELLPGVMPSHQTNLAHSPHQHPVSLGHLLGANAHERCYDMNPTSQMTHHNMWQERSMMPESMELKEMDMEIERELEQKRQKQKEKELEREVQIKEEMDRERQQELNRCRAREQQNVKTLFNPPQAGDVNDTWPKPASRQPQGNGLGRGPYSTLEGHTGACSAIGIDTKNGQMHSGSTPNSSSGMQPKLDLGVKPNPTSRISRNQFLRDRASRLADERSGMSTDEETNTDMLMGRYWTRTERREHFLLAREQKQQQQQQQLQAKGIHVREASGSRGAGAGGAGVSQGDVGMLENRARCNMALELSQRKLSRLRNKKLLDDWTTVEELLTHGTRLGNQEDLLCQSSLLTVTTV